MNDAEKLRSLRLKKGIKQREAAEQLGVCMQTYSRYETGSRKLPLDFIAKAAKLYDVPISYFDEQISAVGIGNNGYYIKNSDSSEVIEVTGDEFEAVKQFLNIFRNRK